MVLNLQVLYLPIGVTNTELKFDISNRENQHKMLLLRDSIVATEPKFWNARIFNNLIEVREITAEWMEHYNSDRPHESLQNISPMQYLLKKKNSPAQDTITEFSPFQQIFPTTTTPK